MKVYACPDDIEPPDFRDSLVDGHFDMAKDDENTQRFFDALKSKLKEMGYQGPLTGEIVRFGYADGNAVYMVADAPRATCLIHCPIGDAWSLPEWQTKGLTKKDIRERLAADKRLAALFSKKDGGVK